jgi:hypothetical protein
VRRLWKEEKNIMQRVSEMFEASKALGGLANVVTGVPGVGGVGVGNVNVTVAQQQQQPPPSVVGGQQANNPSVVGGVGGVPAKDSPLAALSSKLQAANESIWFRVGSLGELMHDYDKAIQAYENVLRHNPANVKALTQIASIFRLREQYNKVSTSQLLLLPLLPFLSSSHENPPTHSHLSSLLPHPLISLLYNKGCRILSKDSTNRE